MKNSIALCVIVVASSCSSSPVDVSSYDKSCLVDGDCILVSEDACSPCASGAVSAGESDRYFEDYEAAARLCLTTVECLVPNTQPGCRDGGCLPVARVE
jgi:hypothetical protein